MKATLYYTFEEKEAYLAKYHELASLMGFVIEDEKGKSWSIFQWFHPGEGWVFGSAMGIGPTVWTTNSEAVARKLGSIPSNGYEPPKTVFGKIKAPNQTTV